MSGAKCVEQDVSTYLGVLNCVGAARGAWPQVMKRVGGPKITDPSICAYKYGFILLLHFYACIFVSTTLFMCDSKIKLILYT